MTIKKKKLPNTIKLTRARAGVPRSYTDNQVKEIASHLGTLPVGKILYPGRVPPFHILGEEHPELDGRFQAYLKGGDQLEMSRELALLSCLETAAWQYKSRVFVSNGINLLSFLHGFGVLRKPTRRKHYLHI